MCACPGSVHEKTVSSSCARNRLEATPDIGATSQVRPVIHIDAYAVYREVANNSSVLLLGLTRFAAGDFFRVVDDEHVKQFQLKP